MDVFGQLIDFEKLTPSTSSEFPYGIIGFGIGEITSTRTFSHYIKFFMVSYQYASKNWTIGITSGTVNVGRGYTGTISGKSLVVSTDTGGYSTSNQYSFWLAIGS